MVSNEGYVEENGEPFPSKEEENVDEDVEEILWEHQWVQAVTLVNWVLIISLQFIKRNNLKTKINNNFYLEFHSGLWFSLRWALMYDWLCGCKNSLNVK